MHPRGAAVLDGCRGRGAAPRAASLPTSRHATLGARSSGARRSCNRLMRLFVFALAALAVVPLAAVASPPQEADSPELRRFESCAELERYLQDLALENIRRNAYAG